MQCQQVPVQSPSMFSCDGFYRGSKWECWHLLGLSKERLIWSNNLSSWLQTEPETSFPLFMLLKKHATAQYKNKWEIQGWKLSVLDRTFDVFGFGAVYFVNSQRRLQMHFSFFLFYVNSACSSQCHKNTVLKFRDCPHLRTSQFSPFKNPIKNLTTTHICDKEYTFCIAMHWTDCSNYWKLPK